MKTSNISHSEDSFLDILEALIGRLKNQPRENVGGLWGQDIPMSGRADVKAIIALDSKGDIHLLISPPTGGEARFSQLELRGLKIANHEWSVEGYPIQQYLDVTCLAGNAPSFMRPFLHFCDDVLREISQTKIIPADAVYSTGFRWKRFWGVDPSAVVTAEWLNGIFGELSFLVDLMERFGPAVVHKWMGPFGKDHDFQSDGDLAVEVKTSTERPFKIHCNIRQLDPTLFKILFVACYQVTSSESGDTIPEIVKRIEGVIGENESLKDAFYERLVRAGYRRELEPVYAQTTLVRTDAVVFRVNAAFPKVIGSSFVQPPDHRISNVRYSLQITGIEELSIDSIISDLKHFIK